MKASLLENINYSVISGNSDTGTSLGCHGCCRGEIRPLDQVSRSLLVYWAVSATASVSAHLIPSICPPGTRERSILKKQSPISGIRPPKGLCQISFLCSVVKKNLIKIQSRFVPQLLCCLLKRYFQVVPSSAQNPMHSCIRICPGGHHKDIT